MNKPTAEDLAKAVIGFIQTHHFHDERVEHGQPLVNSRELTDFITKLTGVTEKDAVELK